MSKPCPYCNAAPKLVTGATLFPHLPNLRSKRFWRCDPCAAHVGCHEGTDKPFGQLANAALRKARTEAHAQFDPIWKLKYMTRTEAYEWLASVMSISVKKCHIGQFDIETCVLVRAVSKEKFQELLLD